jgi:hypothetical protein
MAPSDLDVLPRRQPRYELRLLRSDAPHVPVVVRSRHRFRFLAEWSRRLDADHLRLLPGCALTVVDVRREVAPLPRVEVVSSAFGEGLRRIAA